MAELDIGVGASRDAAFMLAYKRTMPRELALSRAGYAALYDFPPARKTERH
jgi:hypothetical protein